MSIKITENNISSIIDQLPVGIVWFDSDFIIRYASLNLFSFVAPEYEEDLSVGTPILKTGFVSKYKLADKIKDLSDCVPFETTLDTVRTVKKREIREVIKGIPLFNENICEGGILIFEDFKLEAGASGEFSSELLEKISGALETGIIISTADEKIIYASSFENGNTPTLQLCTLFGQNDYPVVKELLMKASDSDGEYVSGIIEENKYVKCFNDGKVNIILVGQPRAFHSAEYEALAGRTAGPFVIADKDGVVLYLQQENGFPVEEPDKYTGNHISEVIPSVNEEYLQRLGRELQKNGYRETEFTFFGKKKSKKHFLTKIFPLSNERIIFLFSDITTRLTEERRLKESEKLLREIVTSQAHRVCVLDGTGKIEYVNPSLRNDLKYSETELSSRYFVSLLTGNREDTAITEINAICGTTGPETHNLRTASGKSKEYKISCSQVKIYNGDTRYYILGLDPVKITKEDLISGVLFDNSSIPCILHDRSGIIACNSSMARFTGYDNPDAIINKPLAFLYEKDYTFTPGKKETVLRNKTGVHLKVIQDSIPAKRGDIYLTSFTEEKSGNDYGELAENVSAAFWQAKNGDEGLTVNYYSPRITDITGYSPEEFFDDPRLWHRIIHPDDRLKVVSALKNLYRSKTSSGKALSYRIFSRSGGVVWIENSVRLKRKQDGSIEKVYGMVNDISEHKRDISELLSQNSTLEKQNEAKDRFLSVISHDLRTPFSSILGFTEMLLQNRSLSDEKKNEYVQYIHDSSNNMLDLVNSLLDWTRLQTGRIKFEPRRLNARSIIFNSINMMSGAAMKKDVILVDNIDNELYVHADENLLMQAFNNLVSNSIKFTPAGGKISISAEILGGKGVSFRVEDTGIGIKEEDIPKLFQIDKKFTTKGTSGEKGSGLGLSLVYEIVKKHGGEISVKSEPGKGTAFEILIPSSSSKILLVDNSKTDRLLYGKLVKNLVEKFDVIEASDGREAWKRILAESPSLVITNHDLPGKNGLELVSDLRRSDLRHKPPVIILSSFLDNVLEQEYKNQNVEFVFKKPVNISTFKFAIEKSLKDRFS